MGKVQAPTRMKKPEMSKWGSMGKDLFQSIMCFVYDRNLPDSNAGKRNARYHIIKTEPGKLVGIYQECSHSRSVYPSRMTTLLLRRHCFDAGAFWSALDGPCSVAYVWRESIRRERRIHMDSDFICAIFDLDWKIHRVSEVVLNNGSFKFGRNFPPDQMYDLGFDPTHMDWVCRTIFPGTMSWHIRLSVGWSFQFEVCFSDTPLAGVPTEEQTLVDVLKERIKKRRV